MKFPVVKLLVSLVWIGIGSAVITPAVSAPELTTQAGVLPIMAKPSPENDSILVAHAKKPVAMKLYIVMHTCPNGSAAKIVKAIRGMSFTLRGEMQFSHQFVIETTPQAAQMLRSQPCVTRVVEDVPVAPTGLSAPSGG